MYKRDELTTALAFAQAAAVPAEHFWLIEHVSPATWYPVHVEQAAWQVPPLAVALDGQNFLGDVRPVQTVSDAAFTAKVPIDPVISKPVLAVQQVSRSANAVQLAPAQLVASADVFRCIWRKEH